MPVPISFTAVTTKKLEHEKRADAVKLSTALLIFHSGLHRRRFGDDVDRTRATLLIHLAVEVAVHRAAFSKGITNLDKPIKKLMKSVEPWVPALAGYDKYRRLRNAAQHEGVAPTMAELESMVRVGEAVLRECFAACDTEFDRLTLTEWVQNKTTRRLLEEAEALAVSGDFVRSAATIVRAHTWIRSMAKQITAKAYDIATWETYDPITGVLFRSATADGRAKHTAILLNGLVTAGLGFDLAEEIRFREETGNDDLGESDLWHAIAYVARHAWRLEDAIPPLRIFASDGVRPSTKKAAYLGAVIVTPESE